MLAVLVLWVLAHSILTYVAPLLGPAGLSGQTDRVLLTFGVASLAGVWTSGMLIDRRLRALVLLSRSVSRWPCWRWDLRARMRQRCMWRWRPGAWRSAVRRPCCRRPRPRRPARCRRGAIDPATVWNVAIAGGGIVGGLLLDACGAGSLPWAALVLAIAALLLAGAARAHGFPAEPRHARRQ